MNKNELINKKMQEHWDYLQEAGYEVVALMLQGSQNYGTDLYTDSYCSDVDTKAIILPTLKQIVNGSMPTSHTHVMPDDSHIDIKDIRVMTDMWIKQNISYIELLFTNYNIVNPRYFDIFCELKSMADEIATINKNQFLRCICGMSGNKLKALEHPYPGLIDKIKKYGYDSKQLLHIIRLNDFTKRYLKGESIKDCYTVKGETLILIQDIRLYKYKLKKAREMSKFYDNDTYNIVYEFIEKNIPDNVNKNTVTRLNDIKAKLIEIALKYELEIINNDTEKK